MVRERVTTDYTIADELYKKQDYSRTSAFKEGELAFCTGHKTVTTRTGMFLRKTRKQIYTCVVLVRCVSEFRDSSFSYGGGDSYTFWTVVKGFDTTEEAKQYAADMKELNKGLSND